MGRKRLVVLMLLLALSAGGVFAVRAVASRGPGLELVSAPAPAPLDALQVWQRTARLHAPQVQRAADDRRAKEEAKRERERKLREKLAAAAKLPAHLMTGKAIAISIAEQRMRVYEDGKVVRSWLVSTGQKGYETPRGEFDVYWKTVNGYSRKWEVVMPYTMAFHGNYAIHQVTHKKGSKTLIGRGNLGRPASHGCIRVDVGNAEWLYGWAPVGTPVWIA